MTMAFLLDLGPNSFFGLIFGVDDKRNIVIFGILVLHLIYNQLADNSDKLNKLILRSFVLFQNRTVNNRRFSKNAKNFGVATKMKHFGDLVTLSNFQNRQ